MTTIRPKSRLTDRALGRALRLPRRRPVTGCTEGCRFRCATGFSCAPTTTPLTDRPLGTILVRGPYGRGFPFSLIYAQIYAARGYHVLLQSVRGTFGSGGQFVPMVHEADDAADTVVWLREQHWFTGAFGTIGLSYLGYTQWALLSDPPPELAAAVISVGPHDFHESSWGSGSFALNDFLGWSDMMGHQELRSVRRLAYQFRSSRRLSGAVHGVPWAARGVNCWVSDRPGMNPGSNTPTSTIRSGSRCG